jgi:hypothetical protein
MPGHPNHSVDGLTAKAARGMRCSLRLPLLEAGYPSPISMRISPLNIHSYFMYSCKAGAGSCTFFPAHSPTVHLMPTKANATCNSTAPTLSNQTPTPNSTAGQALDSRKVRRITDQVNGTGLSHVLPTDGFQSLLYSSMQQTVEHHHVSAFPPV